METQRLRNLYPDAVMISALDGIGLDELLGSVGRAARAMRW